MSPAEFCPERVEFDGIPMHCIRPANHLSHHVAHLSDPTGQQHEITWRARAINGGAS